MLQLEIHAHYIGYFNHYKNRSCRRTGNCATAGNNRTSERGTFSSVPERKLSRRRLVGFLSLPRHSGCENARVTGSRICMFVARRQRDRLSRQAWLLARSILATTDITIAKNRLTSILMDSSCTTEEDNHRGSKRSKTEFVRRPECENRRRGQTWLASSVVVVR